MIPAGTVFTYPDGRSITVLASCPPGTPWPGSPTLDPAPGLQRVGASHDADHDGYLIVAVAGIRFGRPFRDNAAPVALEVWPYRVPEGARAEYPDGTVTRAVP